MSSSQPVAPSQSVTPFLSSLLSHLSEKAPEAYKFNLDDEDIASMVGETKGADENAKQQLAGLLREIVSGGGGDAIKHLGDWASNYSLSVAFLLYANRVGDGSKSDANEKPEFIRRAVAHLGSNLNSLKKEELVTLMLLFYFGRNKWSAEEISAVLDPLVLQQKIAAVLNGNPGNGEVTAICLGLKRLVDVRLTNFDFIDAIHQRLNTISASTEPLNDIDNMALTNIVTLLVSRGSRFTTDDLRMAIMLLKNFSTVQGLELPVAVKVMSFAVRGNLHYPRLTDRVMDDVLAAPSGALGLRDYFGLLNFLTRVRSVLDETKRRALYDAVLQHLVGGGVPDDGDRSAQDASDLLQCLTFLMGVRVCDIDKLSALFKAVNEIPLESVTNSEHLAEEIYRLFFPKSRSSKPDGDVVAASGVDTARFIKNVMLLDAYAELDAPNTFPAGIRLTTERSTAVRALLQERVPLEAHSPQMKLDRLGFRQASAVRAKRVVCNHTDGEGYCELLHLLPHYPEPDLLCGNIGGIAIRVPPDLTTMPPTAMKPAPEVGYWTVLSLDSEFGPLDLRKKSIHPQEQNQQQPPIPAPWFVSGRGINKHVKHAQLKKLGYEVVSVVRVPRAESELTDVIEKVMNCVLFGNELDPSLAVRV